jgi:hypothetical protein
VDQHILFNALRHDVTVSNICKLSFHTENTPFLFTKTNWVSLFREIFDIYSANHTKSTNANSGQYVTVVNVTDLGQVKTGSNK